MRPDREGYLAHLRVDAAALGDVLEREDLTAPVPACPGWTLGDLGAHVTAVHAWATAALADLDPVPFPAVEAGPDLPSRYRAGAGDLLAALAATPSERPCWTFGPPPRVAAFWVRRQAQETLIHRWDAQSSVGVPGPVDPELAADGIDEIMTLHLARQRRRGKVAPIAHTLGLHATDVQGDWLIEADTGTAPAATISGPAADLLLFLWGRRPAADVINDGALELHGDKVIVEQVGGAGLTP